VTWRLTAIFFNYNSLKTFFIKDFIYMFQIFLHKMFCLVYWEARDQSDQPKIGRQGASDWRRRHRSVCFKKLTIFLWIQESHWSFSEEKKRVQNTSNNTSFKFSAKRESHRKQSVQNRNKWKHHSRHIQASRWHEITFFSIKNVWRICMNSIDIRHGNVNYLEGHRFYHSDGHS